MGLKLCVIKTLVSVSKWKQHLLECGFMEGYCRRCYNQISSWDNTSDLMVRNMPASLTPQIVASPSLDEGDFFFFLSRQTTSLTICSIAGWCWGSTVRMEGLSPRRMVALAVGDMIPLP